MRVDRWFLLLLAATPAVYAWWSGRAIRRAIDDPALPELLLARVRRIVQVTLVVIIAAAFMTAPAGFSVVVLFGVLAAQYPIRRAVYGDSWPFWQYARFTSFSWIAFGGLWLFPFIVSGIVVQLVQGWMPESSSRQTMLGLALGAIAAAVYLVWHRYFTRVWLALHHASPLDAGSVHAPLLPRFRTVLERAGTRLPRNPSVHRYGVPGGQIVNAAALCSLHERAVAMSDTLLATLDADEATAIFAHEIAHHEHYTDAVLRKRRLASFVLALLLAVIPALQLASGRYAFAIDALFLGAILAFFARGQRGHRAHETECDLRAVDLTGDADAVIRGLTKIHALARMPRRFSQEFERAATHPSLAHRIQAIRAHASVAAPAAQGPTVVATTTPGEYVALDDRRSYWFEGAPVDAPLDVAALREQAASYRALAYAELGELRLTAETPRMLRAVDLGGRSWSVGIRDEDVGRVQTALDRVDARLGTAPVQSAAASDNTARTVAALVLLATMMAGIWGTTTFVSFIAVFAPSVASLAAMAAMAIGSVVLAFAQGEQMMPYATAAQVIVVAAALWAAWIAWRWLRVTRDGRSREVLSRRAMLWSRTLHVGLVIGILVSLVTLAVGGVSSPAALLGDQQTASAATAVLGLGAALLAARRRAWRLTGVGLAALSVLGITAGTIGERWLTPSPAIAWRTGTLSLVATVPIGREVHEATLSPAGTRFLTQRYVGDEDGDEDSYDVQIVTGSVPAGGPTRTFAALDAVLPNEREVVVLARAGSDSLEVRLERHDSDSASHVVWRHALPTLADAHLRLDARRTRWLVHGRRSDGEHHRLVVVSGGIDGTDVRQVEVPADTLRGQVVYSYGDGASLVLGASPRLVGDIARRSVVASYLSALRGDGVSWTLWRFGRDGSRVVKSLRGYPTCVASADVDVAICVEQGRRAARVWRVERDAFVDLGALSRRYDRATASQGGTVVASSYRGHAIAIVDAMHRRGVRTSLPAGDYSYVREISATDTTVLALLGTARGMRLAVYRLE
ncbi:MAG: M48 family metalloprotease [Gemmatimonadaceae bacterium]